MQALKAGIMEIADIFVVNKADREGADRTAASIEAMLALEQWPTGEWRPPVLRTVATTGAGVPELVAMIERFRARRRRRRSASAAARAPSGGCARSSAGTFMQHLERARARRRASSTRLLDRIAAREIDPYTRGRVDVAGVGAREPATAVPSITSASRCAMPAALVALFATLLGLATGEPRGGRRRIALRFVEAGGATLELVEAAAPDSPIAKFLEKRGPGLHHVCLRVDDIDAALAALEGARRAADRRAAAAGRARLARSRSFIRRAPAACSSSSSSRRRSRGAGRSCTFGDLELIPLSDGFFRLDGGAMFGVVPKPLWERRAPADERNRIPLGMRPLLVRTGRRTPC